MEELEEEEFGERQTTETVRGMRPKGKKKRNVFLISTKWDQVECHIILVKVLCVDVPLSFVI